MTALPYPDFEQFRAAPLDVVRAVAPHTMIYAPAGTRRAAALAGIDPSGQAFAVWTQKQLFRVVGLLFERGVQNLIMPMLGPSQFQETTPDYHEHLWHWFEWGLTGPEALAHYQANNWRVRIVFGNFIERLQAAHQRVSAQTPQNGAPTLWCLALPEYHLPYEWLIQAIHTHNIHSLAEAVVGLYGEAISPAQLYLGSGKPLLSTLQLPPLLISEPLQSYWSQRPGYSLDDFQIRQIFYDYAYLRQTWQQDKTGRSDSALLQREAWEKGPIIGLGQRLGPYWYPAR